LPDQFGTASSAGWPWLTNRTGADALVPGWNSMPVMRRSPPLTSRTVVMTVGVWSEPSEFVA
jgi:hypothetical protein